MKGHGAGPRATLPPPSGAAAVAERLARIEAQLEQLLASVVTPRLGTYLTVQEAMQLLRFTNRNSFYNWLSTQRVPRCRRGRTILVRRIDLDRAVAPAGSDQGSRRAKTR